MPSSVPKITIYSLPPRTLAYYDWLITGLELLKESGTIEIEYTVEPIGGPPAPAGGHRH